MQKKVVTFLSLFLVLLLFIVGCGKTDAPAKEGGDSGEKKDSVADLEDIFWDSDDISWKKDIEPVTIDCYIDYDWYALDTWGEDDVSKEITKRTGVSLNVTKSSDRNQLQVLLATDELPEMIFTDNQVTRFYDTNFVFPFNELIDEYCPEFMALIDPIEIINNTAEDGNFYTLKSHYNSQSAWEDPRNLPSPGDPGFYLRSDIMEELGNPKLESFDDLLEIYAMVKSKYPDMIVYIPHPGWRSPFLEFFGIPGGHKMLDEDGNMIHNATSPQYKEYLMFMNELYRSDYLSVESYAYQPEQFFQIVRGSDQVFSASYNSGLADDTNKNYYDKNNIDAHLEPFLGVLTVDGEDRFQPVDANIGWSSLFISKNCKNPDRAIKYMQFLKSPEGDQLTQWGIEGYHYTLNEDGLLVRPDNFSEMEDTGIGPWYFMASGLGEGVAVSSGKLTNPDYSTGVDLLSFRKPRYLRDPARYFTMPEADTEEMVIEEKIQDHTATTTISIIGSDTVEEAESLYEQFQKDLEQIGVKELNDFYNEKYKEAQKKYE